MEEKLTAWERVKIARSNERPTTIDYIGGIFDRFLELHGDRMCRDDGAIVGGIATIDGIAVTVIGQQKGRNIKQNMKRNFGMPYPEGYRKALRLMKQAEKFHRPVICFVDTPGAFCGIEAEERGQGEAIARNLFEMSALKTPILSIVIGEGGSGGALALAVANEVWMLENATYSILSPEGFASILWKDSKRADEAASIMKITAEDLKELKVVNQVLPELDTREIAELCESEFAYNELQLTQMIVEDKESDKPKELKVETIEWLANELKFGILDFIKRFKSKTPEEIVEERYERFRKF